MAKSSSSHHQDAIKGLWKSVVPHRVEIFAWLAILGKINTRLKLANIGIIPINEAQCILCGLCPEDCSHLLIHCPLSWQLWCWWLNLWGIQWSLPSNLRDTFNQWAHPHHGAFFKKVWLASFFIIIWTIWKERNNRIFQNSSMSLPQLQDLVLLRLSWWIKGWEDPFPYSPVDVVRSPACLQWTTPRSREATATNPPPLPSWCPPPTMVLKWNVDASFNPILQKSAIGGVLQDSLGHFKCMFSSPIPLMEINAAEVFAIHRAIKISLSCFQIQDHSLIIESDSANAVKWCTNKKGGPWNLNFVLNFIRNASGNDSHISITHRGRASNNVADALAKQGLCRDDDFLAWL
ncbi:uncharacterized protein [Spinacia oleracea]|uniref:RNase H type-1 domain-containing protein n=1 Tax=Spinacia oleracea TaxID=3562 RepID=A0ABM3RH64_SPIOL|nr:uncharacterized protein LOC130469596 [Spinacia oleracea]